MADATPSYDLSAVLIPWVFAATLAACERDYAFNTDYTERDPQPGPAVSSGSPRIVLDTSGEPDDAWPGTEVAPGTPGIPGPGGGTLLYRPRGGGTWYGRDAPWWLDAYMTWEGVSESTPDAWDIGLSQDGRPVGGFVEIQGGLVIVVGVGFASASAPGALVTTTLASFPAAVTGSVTLAAGAVAVTPTPDGALHLYATAPDPSPRAATATELVCWRSTDSGNTWTRMGATGIPGLIGSDQARVARAVSVGSQVAVWVSYDTGTNTQTAQYLSADGGYTFRQVGAVQTRAVVWDAFEGGGVAHLLTYEDDGSSGDWGAHRRLGSLAVQAWSTDPSYTGFGGAYTTGLTGWSDGSGRLWVLATQAGGSATDGFRWHTSDDYGATWVDQFAYSGSTTAIGLAPAAVFWRGGAYVLTAGSSGEMSFLRWAQPGSITPGWFVGASGATNYDVGKMFVPVTTLAAAGWTATDSGTVTRTLDRQDGEKITIGAAGSAQSEYQLVLGAGGVAQFTARAGSGTLHVTVQAGAYSVDVDIQPTNIRAYETGGAAPAYTPYAGITYIRVAVSIDLAGNAQVWYTSGDEASVMDTWGGAPTLRTWTKVADLSGLSGAAGNARLRFVLNDAFDEAWVRWAQFQVSVNSLLRVGTTDLDDPSLLRGVAVGADLDAYLDDGIFVRGRRGPVARDGSTWTILPDSPYRKANVLPTVASSPRRPWRSADLSASATLRFSPSYGTGDAAVMGQSTAVGIWLDGLYGIASIEVAASSTGTLTTLTLGEAIGYQTTDGVSVTIVPHNSGTAGPYLMPGECAGGIIYDAANGRCYDIEDHTEGSLDDRASATGLRPVFELPQSSPASAVQSGTARVIPPRALIIIQDGTGAVDQIRLKVNPAASAPKGYMQIGTACIGTLTVLGRAADRTMSYAVEAGNTLTTLPDGSRYSVARAPVRTRTEFAWVDSHTDLTQVRKETQIPDYVTISDEYNNIAGTRYGVPLVTEGTFRRLRASDSLCVLLPRLPPQASGAADALLYQWQRGLGAVYGRLVSAHRREQIGIGEHGKTDAYRVPTLTIEEEV